MNIYFYIPLFFLLFCILVQLIINSKLINNSSFNYPILDVEAFWQTNFFFYYLFIITILNFNLEGVCAYNILKFNASANYLQLFFIIVVICILPSIFINFKLQKLNFVEFYSILLIAILSMLFLIEATSLLTVYLCVELQTICFYILTAYNKSSAFSSEAGLKYFIISAVFSGIFLLGTAIIYLCFGTVNFNDIHIITLYNLSDFNNFFKVFTNIGLLLIIFWFLFKLTCAPFHFWAADVYEGAPLSATIVFSILPKIVLLYIFIKWIDAFNIVIQNLEYLLLFVGLISCFTGTIFSLMQQRIKRLIIYSAIAQIGYVCSVVGVSTLDAFISSFIFLIIYVITSILVWNHITLLYNFQIQVDISTYNQSKVLYLTNFSKLIKKNNSLTYSLVIIMFSISGLPPLFGFFSKFSIISTLIEFNEYILSIFFIIISSLSVFYYIRLLKISFFETITINNSADKINFLTENTTIIAYIHSINLILLIFLIIGLFFPQDVHLFSSLIFNYL